MNKICGAIFAHACGDYLGMPVEFTSTSEKVKNFFGKKSIRPISINSRGIKPAGYYTDDTAMMLCLAQSLIEKGFDTKDQFNKYKKWAFEGYMSADGKTAFGIGQNTIRKLIWQKEAQIPTTITNDEKEGGNGALMRCLPIGLVYSNSIDELVDKSIKSSLVTHNNEIAVWSCVVFNTFISYALQGIDKEKYIETIVKEKYFSELPAELSNMLKNIRSTTSKNLNTSGYSLNTLQIALYSFFNTTKLKEAIETSILLGGDTDTQGAVTGGLVGAYYGYEAIPTDWIENLQNKELIRNIAERLFTLTVKAFNT